MMRFSDLSQTAQIAVCLLYIALTAAFLLFFLLSLLNRKKHAWIELLSALASQLVFQPLMDYHDSVYQMRPMYFSFNAGKLPCAAIVGAAAALTILLVRSAAKYRRMSLAGQLGGSVKEAVDDLPTGICCYLENGRVLLVNEAMERVSLALSGHAVLNGNELAETPSQVKVLDRIFHLEKAEMPGLEGVYQLLAADVTEEYGRLEEIREKNAQLSEQSLRLSSAIREAERLSIEREYLDAKIKVHSGIGELLAATVRMIREEQAELDPGTPPVSDLLDRWTRLPATLLDEGAARRSSYDSVLKAAKDVGVRIVLDGELPEEEPQRSVLLVAIAECITNTFRHAGGDELTIRCRNGEVVFTNNGKAPERPVEEKGGLANLRRLAKDAGAEMTVESSPGFCLTLRWE